MNIKNILVFITLLISSGQAFSVGVSNSFFVENVRVDASGKGYVRFSKQLASEGGLPVCSTHSHHLAFNVNTMEGKAIMSLVLAAKASKKPVYAKGTGDCSIYSVVESWDWGRIE